MTAPQENRSKIPPPTLSELKHYGEFDKVQTADIARAYDVLGIPPGQRLITGLYLGEQGMAIGVAPTGEERTRHHFTHVGIYRGVDQLLLIDQTAQLRDALKGTITEGRAPHITRIADVGFSGMALTPVTLNTVVRPLEGQPHGAQGSVYSGDTKLTEAKIIRDLSQYEPVGGGDIFDSEEGMTPVSHQETEGVLRQFGYGASKMLVDAGAVTDTRGRLILSAWPGRFDGYAVAGVDVVPELELVEGLAQALLIQAAKKGDADPSEKVPLFAKIEEVTFARPVEMGSLVVFDVTRTRGFRGEGKILCGDTLVGEGKVQGVLIGKDRIDEQIVKRREVQATESPVFS